MTWLIFLGCFCLFTLTRQASDLDGYTVVGHTQVRGPRNGVEVGLSLCSLLMAAAQTEAQIWAKHQG